MSVQSFIRSFKRFAARRGTQKKLFSDNWKTFTAAAKAFKAISENETVSRLLLGFKIEWQFNIKRAAWWGRLFERLICSVKRCLRKVVGKASLTYDQLNTAIIEVESVLNCRPISHFSTEDHDEPLTPIHLITSPRLMSLQDGLCYQRIDDDMEITPISLNKRLRHLNRIIDNFWTRWRSEYLLGLREHHRVSSKISIESKVSVGDVVIIHKGNHKRGFWDLGTVVEVIPGKDDLIRHAIVKMCSGGKRITHLRRSVRHLYPLEINCNEWTCQTSTFEQSNTDENRNSVITTRPNDDTIERRPRRAGATIARDRIVAQTLSD